MDGERGPLKSPSSTANEAFPGWTGRSSAMVRAIVAGAETSPSASTSR
jgi:hypothetical protein